MITHHFILVCSDPERVRKSLRLSIFDKSSLEEQFESRYEQAAKLCDYDPPAADKFRIIMTDKKILNNGIERAAIYEWGTFQTRATYGKFTGSVLVHEIGHYFLDLIRLRNEKMPYKMQEIFCQHLDRLID